MWIFLEPAWNIYMRAIGYEPHNKQSMPINVTKIRQSRVFLIGLHVLELTYLILSQWKADQYFEWIK